jgi:hypothetical protein
MTHPDLELLLAGVDHAPDDVLRHVAECPECQEDLATIRRARAAGDLLHRDPELSSLTAPPPAVWDAIRRELAEDDQVQVEVQAEVRDEVQDAAVVPLTPGRSRRSPWTWVAAAVVGALLGSGVTWAVTQRSSTDSTTTATSALSPLGDHSTSGTISLSGSGGDTRVSLDVSGVAPGPGFVEVWLLDAATGGMVSLGVLDGDHGSWAVPADLDLTAYDQVDVSREPYDGNPAHSKDSLARGRLP